MNKPYKNNDLLKIHEEALEKNLNLLSSCKSCELQHNNKFGPVHPYVEGSLKQTFTIMAMKLSPSLEEAEFGQSWTDGPSMYIMNLVHRYFQPETTYWTTLIKCYSQKSPKKKCKDACVALYGIMEFPRCKYLLTFGRDTNLYLQKNDIILTNYHYPFESPYNIMMSRAKENQFIEFLTMVKGQKNVQNLF